MDIYIYIYIHIYIYIYIYTYTHTHNYTLTSGWGSDPDGLRGEEVDRGLRTRCRALGLGDGAPQRLVGVVPRPYGRVRSTVRRWRGRRRRRGRRLRAGLLGAGRRQHGQQWQQLQDLPQQVPPPRPGPRPGLPRRTHARPGLGWAGGRGRRPI